ncbi:unnamed protein product, partial [Protopolystoma xenopodis]
MTRLEAQILADIQPIQVKWMMGDRELVQSDHVEISYFQDTGVARVVIRNVGPPDVGLYTCVAIDSQPSSPIFVAELSPINVLEGEEIFLTATVQ